MQAKESVRKGALYALWPYSPLSCAPRPLLSTRCSSSGAAEILEWTDSGLLCFAPAAFSVGRTSTDVRLVTALYRWRRIRSTSCSSPSARSTFTFLVVDHSSAIIDRGLSHAKAMLIEHCSGAQTADAMSCSKTAIHCMAYNYEPCTIPSVSFTVKPSTTRTARMHPGRLKIAFLQDCLQCVKCIANEAVH